MISLEPVDVDPIPWDRKTGFIPFYLFALGSRGFLGLPSRDIGKKPLFPPNEAYCRFFGEKNSATIAPRTAQIGGRVLIDALYKFVSVKFSVARLVSPLSTNRNFFPGFFFVFGHYLGNGASERKTSS